MDYFYASKFSVLRNDGVRPLVASISWHYFTQKRLCFSSFTKVCPCGCVHKYVFMCFSNCPHTSKQCFMHPPKGMMTKCQTRAVTHFVKNSPNVDFCASGVFKERIMEKSGLPLKEAFVPRHLTFSKLKYTLYFCPLHKKKSSIFFPRINILDTAFLKKGYLPIFSPTTDVETLLEVWLTLSMRGSACAADRMNRGGFTARHAGSLGLVSGAPLLCVCEDVIESIHCLSSIAWC